MLEYLKKGFNKWKCSGTIYLGMKLAFNNEFAFSGLLVLALSSQLRNRSDGRCLTTRNPLGIMQRKISPQR
jgi:hypothetical protein